jgi:small ligand-binding sensory domain FIST
VKAGGALLAHLNQQVPGAVVMGGIASGGLARRQSQLFLDGRVLASGAVGAHRPRAEVHPLVAQGCRPIGDPYTTTRADGNVIMELGRGSRLFPAPDHDAGLLARTLGQVPMAGFFCAGEIGPVGGQNFLHAFTASIALFPETAP